MQLLSTHYYLLILQYKLMNANAVEPGRRVREYARNVVALGEMVHSILNQSTIFVGVVVCFLSVSIIRLRSLLLAAAIPPLIENGI